MEELKIDLLTEMRDELKEISKNIGTMLWGVFITLLFVMAIAFKIGIKFWGN
jgi:tetrahydromethanopterin S-methyltransferase subunit B